MAGSVHRLATADMQLSKLWSIRGLKDEAETWPEVLYWTWMFKVTERDCSLAPVL